MNRTEEEGELQTFNLTLKLPEPGINAGNPWDGTFKQVWKDFRDWETQEQLRNRPDDPGNPHHDGQLD